MPEEQRDDSGGGAVDVSAAPLLTPAEQLNRVRQAACDEAESLLQERGFVVQMASGRHWVGSVVLPRSGTSVSLKVRLPVGFPDVLPKVAVTHEDLPKRVAHVEGSGNVCVAPTDNLLLDADRPAALLADVLRRAIEVLDKGLLGESDADLDAEFEAYWSATEPIVTLSLCDADGPARRIAITNLEGGSILLNASRIVGDSPAKIKLWAKNVGAKAGLFRAGLFMPLSASVPLAPAGQPTTVSDISELVAEHSTPEGRQLFLRAIKQAEYPQLIILSMPDAPAGSGRRLAGVTICRPEPAQLKQAAKGFRPKHIRPARVLAVIGRSAVHRLRLRRIDFAFLTARGGAAKPLAQATVVVVGIGAVGSEVVRNLAAVGVGRIRLVDREVMSPDNVHRHVLGMASTDENKAAALITELRPKFPHLEFESRDEAVQSLLESEPPFVLNADLIVLATGDETLERRMNRLLHSGPPVLHAWLEPLGLAGHAFVSATGGAAGARKGCFECLYREDAAIGLINRTALTAPGQEIRKSLAGCAGTFSPFSALDARRTAVEASELATRVLTGATVPPVLVSWRGLTTDFEDAGYQLSGRASQITPGARIEVAGADLVRDDCPTCGGHASS